MEESYSIVIIEVRYKPVCNVKCTSNDASVASNKIAVQS